MLQNFSMIAITDDEIIEISVFNGVIDVDDRVFFLFEDFVSASVNDNYQNSVFFPPNACENVPNFHGIKW